MSPGRADEASPKTPDSSIEEVVVTGSRIARTDARAASAVMVLDRAQLEAFEGRVEDVLNQLPQFVPGQNRSTTFGGDGTATVDLRGLGSARTLTLLNGRRLGATGATSGVGSRSAVDISVIPGVLLDRVEIVTGGASTVYGSDAIAGAVNFIVRDDFEGLEIGSRFDIFGSGDGESLNVSLATGTRFSNGRGRVVAYVDHLDRSPLFGRDRDFTRQFLAEDRATGEILTTGSPVIPAGIVFFPLAQIDGQFANAVFNGDGSVRAFSREDLYNTATNVSIQAEQERWSAGTFANFELGSGTELYSELMYSDVLNELQYPITNFRELVSFSVDSPFFDAPTRQLLRTNFDGDNDGIAQIFLGKRFTELGPRNVPRQSRNYRAVLGFHAGGPSNWQFDGYYSYDRSNAFYELGNGISLSRVRQGLLVDSISGGCTDPSGGCVPVNVFGEGNLSQSAIDYIRVDGIKNRFETRQHVASLVATGSMQEWPLGNIGVSAGVEYRRNSSSYRPSSILETGDLSGFSIAGVSLAGAVEVYEAFGELLVPVVSGSPLVNRLELELGGRYSHYSSLGGVWSWKGGLQWILSDRLRVHGMVQRAVRAPAIEDLLTPPSTNDQVLSGGTDFCLAANDPIGRGLTDVCIAQGMDPSQLGVYGALGSGIDNAPLPYTSVARGNPDLDAERAKTVTFGADLSFDVFAGLQFGADYFSVELENAIGIASDPFALCELEKNPLSRVCGLITRRPDGFLSEVTFRPLNNSVLKVRGIDVDLRFNKNAPAWIAPSNGAELSIHVQGTHYFEFGGAASALSPFVDCAGGFERACPGSIGSSFPDKLVTTTFGYSAGAFTGALRWRWLSEVTNLAPVFAEAAGSPAPVLAIPTVGDQHYVDASIHYQLSMRSKLSAGVTNLFENDPPLLGFEASQINTDPGRYDVYGRRFFISFDMKLGTGN